MALFEPLFRALNDAGVRYVVVGGLAVVLHGHARLTVDVDLVVDLDEVQARKAIDALVGLGLRPRVPVDARQFADRSIRESWIRDRGMEVFSMFDPANPMRVIDLFVDHPIPFGELWSRAESLELQDTTVRVASIPDLIRLKRLAGRDQDRADIAQLETILRARKEARERTDG
jgi:predicted nucleotidyltransferase